MKSHMILHIQYHRENQKWLVDAGIRMICVFALDRFADFVSDQVNIVKDALSRICNKSCAPCSLKMSGRVPRLLPFFISKNGEETGCR